VTTDIDRARMQLRVRKGKDAIQRNGTGAQIRLLWALRERKVLLMFRRKSQHAGPKRRRLGRYIAANPLWPLEELHDLRNAPFVADPEFTRLDICALGPGSEGAAAPSTVPAPEHPSKPRRFPTVRREFPIPHLVSGLPWRFAQHIKPPVVPESEFTPFYLSHIG
jgi:hypothetical protein